ncbi:hypothetical protein BB561_000519 [Smittium simulii]|uniref:Uncharacterized protein n=1 Tax=Smittium simulii TaxID=133385 RepID=A0A2T9YYX2_9FUNG|nr:hypothetical protein BB561_000519 [Smittium simulii]
MTCQTSGKNDLALKLSKCVLHPRFLQTLPIFDCIKLFSKSLVSLNASIFPKWSQEMEYLIKNRCTKQQSIQLLKELQQICLDRIDVTMKIPVNLWLTEMFGIANKSLL